MDTHNKVNETNFRRDEQPAHGEAAVEPVEQADPIDPGDETDEDKELNDLDEQNENASADEGADEPETVEPVAGAGVESVPER